MLLPRCTLVFLFSLASGWLVAAATSQTPTPTRAPTKSAPPQQKVPKPKARPDVVLPERNREQLQLIPTTPLTEGQLPAEVDRILRDLRAGLDKDDLGEAQAAIAVAKGDSTLLANFAAVAWVQEAPGPALLLAAEAAHASPTDPNAVNTLGALLVNAGYEFKGIPLLKNLAARYPDSATVHNNLGQAWLRLGAIAEAEESLKRCLFLAPAHGAAHAALGLCAEAAGDPSGATAHFQAAAASNYSPTATELLEKHGEPYHAPHSLYGVVRVKDYFSPSQFTPPRPQRVGVDYETKRLEKEEYLAFLNKKVDEVNARTEQHVEEARQRSNAVMPLIAAGGIAGFNAAQSLTALSGPPFLQTLAMKEYSEATKVSQILQDQRKAYDKDVETLRVRMERQLREADAAFRKQYPNFGEGSSDAAFAADRQRDVQYGQIVDAYLQDCSDRYQTFEDAVLGPYRFSINLRLSYLPVAVVSVLRPQTFDLLEHEYLDVVQNLTQSQVIHTPMGPNPMTSGPTDKPVGALPPPGDCPINLSMDLGPITFKGDCSSFGFTFAAGLAFSANKNFTSGETTLTAGVGEKYKIGSVVGSKGTTQLVLTWGRDNNLSFVGMDLTAEAHLNGIEGLSGKTEAEPGVYVEAKSSDLLDNISQVKANVVIGVTIGPNGATPEMRGSAAASTLGVKFASAKF
jgi:tetratricopeptide (TPR) repeat protein